MNRITKDFNYFVFIVISLFFILDILELMIQNFFNIDKNIFYIQLFIITSFLFYYIFLFVYPDKKVKFYFLLCFSIYLFSKLFIFENQPIDFFYLFSIPIITFAVFEKNSIFPIFLNIVFGGLLIIYFQFYLKTKIELFVLIKFYISFFIVILLTFSIRRIKLKYINNHQINIEQLTQKNEELIKFQNKLNENLYQLASKNIELNNTMKKLEMNENKFKRLLEDIGEGFIILDIKGNFLYSNPAITQIFETQETQLIGKNINDFLTENTIKKLQHYFKRVLKNSTVSFEFDLNINSKLKNIIVTLSPHYDFDNRIIGILMVLRDITEILNYQKEIQIKNDQMLTIQEEIRQANEELTMQKEELQKVNDRLYSIFENLPVGLILYDNHSCKVQFANVSAIEIIKLENFLDLDIKKFFDFEISNQQNFAQESEILDSKGNVIKILFSTITINFNNQELVLISFIDITELSKAQQTIILQKKLQDTLINNIPDFIYIKDTQLRYLLVNRALAEDLNKQQQEIIGKNVSEFLSSELAEFYNKMDYQVLQTQKPIYNIEQKFVSPQGKERWTLVSKLPLFDENNNIYAIIGISRDITEQKIKEEIIIEKNRQFENTIKNLEDIYFKTDLEGNLIFASKSIEKHFQHSIEEIKKMDIFKKFIKSLNFSIDKYKQNGKILENKSFKNISFNFKLKNGKNFYGIVNLNVWTNKLDQPAGFEGIITNTTEITQLQNELLNKNKILNVTLEITRSQKEKIEEFYNNLTDNINYAQTIQFSLLPNTEIFRKFFEEYFLFFQPRDIVSGDFYFVNKKEHTVYFAVGDCTGHGVTGAFLTILSISYLNQILYESNVPNTAGILNKLRSLIQQTFKDTGSFNNNGLDISICSYNTQTKILQFSAANQSIYIAKNGIIQVISGDRMPIGFYFDNRPFNFFEYNISDNQIIYMFSDGYTDQFTDNENEKLKKFGTKRLKLLLDNISNLSINEQYNIIKNTFFEWMGTEQQVDDVTFLGVKL